MFKPHEITNWEELSSHLQQSEVSHNLEQISRAYEYAARIHQGDVRKSGTSRIQHLLTVADYITQLNLDDTAVIAALLHEVLDKDDTKLDEIDKLFGTDVAFIVSGLTDLKDHTRVFDKHNEDPQNFRHLIINGTDDIRILIIRLANKLHDMQSLEVLSPEQRSNQAHKILSVYAPLCEYTGLGSFQGIFENMAFKYAYPQEAEIIQTYVDKLISDKTGNIERLIAEVCELLSQYNVVPLSTSFRAKNIYSIYNKVKRKYFDANKRTVDESDLTKIKDILGVRLILNSVEECYLALGLLHGNWEFYSEEFDDYIVRPKPSGYKSIHTVIDFDGQPVEIQIRTEEMHEFNEFGPASHIAYKLRSYTGNASGQNFDWTKDLTKWKNPGQISKEDYKIKAFANSVFVFTPKGKVIQLDKGSTPVDFAFRIHTNLGARYIGAKVNNVMRPMSHELKTGDIVEVLEGNKINVTLDWIKHAAMNSTKAKIRKFLRNE